MQLTRITPAQIILMGLLAFTGVSCANSGGSAAADELSPVQESASAQDTVSYTGVVIDGAMNSIFIKMPAGDTLSFGYPNLNRDKIQNYIINDTVTVNTQADTVISIMNDSAK